MLRLLYNLIF